MSNFFPLFFFRFFFFPFVTLSLKKKNPQSYKPQIFLKSQDLEKSPLTFKDNITPKSGLIGM